MVFDYINAIIHLIYENTDIFITTLLSSHKTFVDMKQWMAQYHIHFDWIDSLSDEDLSLILRRKEVIHVESLLHKDIQQELNTFIVKCHQMPQYIYLPKLHLEDTYTFDNYVFQDNSYLFYNQSVDIDTFLCFNPSNILTSALLYADRWPAILKIDQNKTSFYPIEKQLDIEHIFNNIALPYQPDDTFFLHLSDLHLGTKKNNNGKNALLKSLDNLYSIIHPTHQTKVLLTGDLMNSPNRKNMYLASGFMNELRKRYKVDITFILGNHDVIVHGLNLLRVQKAKVVAYLLGENIKVLEKEKIILIKINSAYEGNLARGKVGQQQLQEIDEELEAISNLSDYQLMVLIHHHVFPVAKADFLKKKWVESKALKRIMESSKVLIDSDELIEWLQKRNVHYILHGHKHIPFFTKYESFHVIASGSSCGYLKEKNMKYLSYNVLRFDHYDNKMKVCLIYYDAASKNEGKRVELHLFDE